MTSIQTIGSNLRKLEQRTKYQKQLKRQQCLNTLVTWLMILMIGVGLGYGWRMQQTKDQKVVHVSEWTKQIEKLDEEN